MGDSTIPPEGLTAAQRALLRLVYGAQAAQVIYVFTKLGLPDMLKEEPRTSSELARAASIDEPTLRRLLRSVASLGLCAEVDPGHFALTEMSQYLRSDRPDSLRARALFNGEVLFPLWGELLNTVRSGESGSQIVYGMPLYQYFATKPEIGGLFDRTQASATPYRLAPAVAAYDFSRFRTIVDIGGGNGTLILAILGRYPKPKGVILELPTVAERARERIQKAGFSHRCTSVGGDAVESVPQGADCYIMANFLVGMNDPLATSILRNCRVAMTRGGVVILVESLILDTGESVDPFTSWDIAAMDINMLAIDGTGGSRVRTTSEFRALLEDAGLTVSRIIPTGSSVSIIEALPTVEDRPGARRRPGTTALPGG